MEGTILEPARVRDATSRIKVRVHAYVLDGKAVPIDELLSVTIYRHAPVLFPGDKIHFPARLRKFKNFNNPGRYDHESAMRSAGISCAASVSDGRRVVVLGKGELPFPMGALEGLRGPVRNFFREVLDPREAALFSALVLGERQGIEDSLREYFNRTGLGHVLAVSGLHVGLIATVCFLLFRRLLVQSYRLTLAMDTRRWAAVMTCLPVVLYAGLAGFQVSAQRAMIMVLVFLGSIILGRERDIWSSVALAALIILVLDPHALQSISFQLSFMAVIGILWLSPPLLRKTPLLRETGVRRHVLERFYGYILGLIVVSLAVTIFLLPVTALYFNRISLVTIPANLTVVPILGFWVLPLALLSALTLAFSPFLANLILQVSALGLQGMMGLIDFWSGLPYSSLWVVTPNLMEILLFYGVLFFILSFRGRPWAKVGLLLSLTILTADVAYWVYRTHFNRDLRVTYLDVGQGSSALVEFPRGKRMLIDGGGYSGNHFDIGKMVVSPFLWHSKITKVDYLVLSHPHADHMNGFLFIAGAFRPEEFWYNGDETGAEAYKELMGILDAEKIKKMLPRDLEGGREINGARVEILHPPGDKKGLKLGAGGRGLNNNSLVLQLSFGEKTFLFPGDLELAGEESLLARAGDRLKSDFLLAPHHGCRSSSTLPFLEKVKPTICIISSGEGNMFGFPHPEIVSRVASLGAKVIRIDQEGAVSFVLTRGRWRIRTFLEGERGGQTLLGFDKARHNEKVDGMPLDPAVESGCGSGGSPVYSTVTPAGTAGGVLSGAVQETSFEPALSPAAL
jgi:competence protein ComEC